MIESPIDLIIMCSFFTNVRDVETKETVSKLHKQELTNS